MRSVTLQKRENFKIAPGVRRALWSGTVAIRQVRVRAMSQERPDDVDMTILDRQDQGPMPFCVEGVHINITRQSVLQAPGVTALGCAPESFGRSRRGGAGGHGRWGG